jgi:glycosyltransferase involved in cell wall biosynthesis
MRILMYSTYFPPHYSGAAKQGISLAKKLRNHGHEVEFITLQRQGENFAGEFEGFKVWRISEGTGKRREFLFWWNFFMFVWRRRNDFDILHSHGAYYYNSFIGPLARIFGKRSLVKTSLANNDLAGLGKGLSGRLHRFFLDQVDLYIAISQELREEFKVLKFPDEQVLLIPNGVDTDRFRPLTPEEKEQKKRSLGFGTQHRIALTVGVFDKRKNIGWLINEWVQNDGFGTQAKLLAIGPQSRDDKDGSFLQSLKDTADNSPQMVQILDHVDSIEDYFQIADVFILSSTNEGMPNVVLEAMAAGLPCIATAVSGCGDLVKNGSNGFLFPPNDSAGLQSALQQLFAGDVVSFGAASRDLVETQFSMNALARRYSELYEKLRTSS